MNARRTLLLMSILSLSIFASSAFAQSDAPSVSATVPAFARPAPRKPIPLALKIAIVMSAAVASLALLAFAARRWRSWNLFDRQYRFPRAQNVALRLGATRSGGCMATLDLRRDSTSEHT